MSIGLTIAILCAILALVFSGIWIRGIYIQSTGNQRMQEIAAAIQQGASAYLKRQYTTIGIVGAVLFVALWLALGWDTAIGFALGAFLSGAAGFLEYERIGSIECTYCASSECWIERSASNCFPWRRCDRYVGRRIGSARCSGIYGVSF